MEYKILLATEKDIKEIINLYKKRIIWFNKNNINQWDLNYLNIHNDTYLKQEMKINKLYIVKKDNKVIGSVLLKEEDNRFWNDDLKSYYLRHLVTDVNYKNVGKLLINFIIEKAKNNKKECIRLDCKGTNEKLNNYYKEIGFIYKGKKQVKDSYENLWQLTI